MMMMYDVYYMMNIVDCIMFNLHSTHTHIPITKTINSIGFFYLLLSLI